MHAIATLAADSSHGRQIDYCLPALASRFPVTINPHYNEQTDRAANAWAMAQFAPQAKGSEAAQPVRLDNFTIWAALAYPDLDAGALMQWCRFNALFTCVENKCEQMLDTQHEAAAVSVWDSIVLALYRMQGSANPFQIARAASSRPEVQQCLLLTCELAEGMSKPKARHFFHCVAKMVHAQRDEHLVLTTADMDINDFLDYRAFNYGIPLFTAAAGGMLKEDLSQAEWNHPARVQLEALVARQCCLVNDLYSFEKECRERGDRRPLIQAVSVLMASEGLDVQQAIDRLVGIIQSLEDEYVRVRDALLSEPMISKGFREYCHRLEDIMAGNLRYMLISPRYYGADFTGEFEGGVRSIQLPLTLDECEAMLAAA